MYVEFDGLEWEKREWVKVHEDYRVFLLEKRLVWAWRKDTTQLQGSKVKQIQWPALVSDLVLPSIAFDPSASHYFTAGLMSCSFFCLAWTMPVFMVWSCRQFAD